jgi:hypothetical protein
MLTVTATLEMPERRVGPQGAVTETAEPHALTAGRAKRAAQATPRGLRITGPNNGYRPESRGEPVGRAVRHRRFSSAAGGAASANTSHRPRSGIPTRCLTNPPPHAHHRAHRRGDHRARGLPRGWSARLTLAGTFTTKTSSTSSQRCTRLLMHYPTDGTLAAPDTPISATRAVRVAVTFGGARIRTPALGGAGFDGWPGHAVPPFPLDENAFVALGRVVSNEHQGLLRYRRLRSGTALFRRRQHAERRQFVKRSPL